MKHIRKKSIALVAGLAITGIVGASAASLNGIGNENLSADAAIVASCDPNGVDVAYNTSFATSGTPAVANVLLDSITVSGVDEGCAQQLWEIEVFDGNDVSLGSVAGGPIASSTFLASFAAPVDAEAVAGISIVISG